jgi:hypothetical protein
MADDKIEAQILECFDNTCKFFKFGGNPHKRQKSSVPKNYFKAVGMNYRQISNIVPEWWKDE